MNPFHLLRRLIGGRPRPAPIPAEVAPPAAAPALADGALPPPQAPVVPVPPAPRGWRRWWPSGVEREARAAARGTYDGPAAEEPTAARMLQDLYGVLSVLHRTDPLLHAAREEARLTEHAHEDAMAAHAAREAETEAAIVAARAVDMGSTDPEDIGRWTAGARAEVAREEAARAVRQAAHALTAADRALAAAEGQAIDRVAMAAATGLGPINAYLAAFDRARAHLGRPGVGVLGLPVVEQLVRTVVQPLDVTGEAAHGADDAGPDGVLHAA
jgi:hypothetical protein